MYNASGRVATFFTGRETMHGQEVGHMERRRGVFSAAVGSGLDRPPTLLAQPMPQLVQQDGRATLMVDGAPYFILGAQVDNSSGWPERLDAVWPAAEALRLNTLEVPVYWEQLEPKRGAFDFTVVDSILQQARPIRSASSCSGSAPGRTARCTTSPTG
jgi:hypothetical protein